MAANGLVEQRTRPDREVPAWVLRLNAVYDLLIALLLLLSPVEGFYDALDVPHPAPEIFTQLAGALMVGYAYLLWTAPKHPALALQVSRASAVVNGFATVVVLWWLLFGDLDTHNLGKSLLLLVGALHALFTLYEARALAFHPEIFGWRPHRHR